VDHWTAAAVLFIGVPMIVLGILGWQKAFARMGKRRAELDARWPTKDEAPLFDQVFGAKIKCAQCQNPVSATAATCPKCGARVERESSFPK
jgi:zinc-ribbon domain